MEFVFLKTRKIFATFLNYAILPLGKQAGLNFIYNIINLIHIFKMSFSMRKTLEVSSG